MMATTQQVGPVPASTQVKENAAWSASGIAALLLGLAALAGGGALAGFGAAEGSWVGEGSTVRLAVGIVVLVTAFLIFRGLTAVVPGQARAVQLFGRYHGTIRSPGLHWVNPFADRRRVSTRSRNL